MAEEYDDGAWISHAFVPTPEFPRFCKAWLEEEQDYCGWRDDEHVDYPA